MRSLAVIPARSGSKGIPHKNIRCFQGKPLLAHSIEYAKRSESIDLVIVSTDSERYADIALKHGAKILELRPKNLAADDTQDYPVARHELELAETQCGHEFDLLVWLRPTSPVRPPGLIEAAISQLVTDPKLGSVRAVRKVSEHAYRQWYLKEGLITPVCNEVFEPGNLPRQKLPDLWFQSGEIEAVRRQTLLQGSMSGRYVAPLFVTGDSSIDIDTERDFDDLQKNYP